MIEQLLMGAFTILAFLELGDLLSWMFHNLDTDRKWPFVSKFLRVIIFGAVALGLGLGATNV